METETIDAKQAEESSASEDANRESSSNSAGDTNAKSMADVLKASFERSVKTNGTQAAAEGEEEAEESGSGQEQDSEQEEVDAKKPEGEADDESGEQDEQGEEEDSAKDAKVKAEAEAKQKAENERLDKLPRFQELNAKVKTLEPQATLGKAVSDYVKQNKIPQEVYTTGMDTMRMWAQGDWEGFMKTVGPMFEHAQRQLGEVLDDDLKKAVEAGEMTEARAKQFQKMQNQQRNGTRMTEAQRVELTQQAYNQAMDGWVQDKQRLDLEFKPKAEGKPNGIFELTQANYSLALSQNPGKTPLESVKLLEQAYQDAKATLSVRAAKPTITKKKVMRSSGGGGTNGAKAPGSLAEVMKQTWDRHMSD